MSGANNHSIVNGIGSTISQVEKAISASLRPLPTATGNGTYITEPDQTGIVKDLSHVDFTDIKALLEVVKDAVTGQPVDDRHYIMERVIQVSAYSCLLNLSSPSDQAQLAAGLPSTSKNGKDLPNAFLKQLWNDLEHPPIS